MINRKIVCSFPVLVGVWIASSLLGFHGNPAFGRAKDKCQGPQCECSCDHIKDIEREIADAQWLAQRHTQKQLEMRDKEHAAARENSGNQKAYEGEVNKLWNKYNNWAKNQLPKDFQGGRGYKQVSSVQFDSQKHRPDPAQLKKVQDISACKLIAERFVRHENAHAAKRKGGGGNTLPSQLAEEERFIYLDDAEFLKNGLKKLKAQCKGKAFGPVRFVARLGGKVSMTQTLSGKVCGDPLKDIWEVQQSFAMRGVPAAVPNKETRSDTDCLAPDDPILQKRMNVLRSGAGGRGGGWLCIYNAGPPETVTIHLFANPMMGYGAKEQPIPWPLTAGICEKNVPSH